MHTLWHILTHCDTVYNTKHYFLTIWTKHHGLIPVIYWNCSVGLLNMQQIMKTSVICALLYCSVQHLALSIMPGVILKSWQHESQFSFICKKAVRVSGARLLLASVWIFLTMEKTLSLSALLWGRHSRAGITFPHKGNLSSPKPVLEFRICLHIF